MVDRADGLTGKEKAAKHAYDVGYRTGEIRGRTDLAYELRGPIGQAATTLRNIALGFEMRPEAKNPLMQITIRDLREQADRLEAVIQPKQRVTFLPSTDFSDVPLTSPEEYERINREDPERRGDYPGEVRDRGVAILILHALRDRIRGTRAEIALPAIGEFLTELEGTDD